MAFEIYPPPVNGQPQTTKCQLQRFSSFHQRLIGQLNIGSAETNLLLIQINGRVYKRRYKSWQPVDIFDILFYNAGWH